MQYVRMVQHVKINMMDIRVSVLQAILVSFAIKYTSLVAVGIAQRTHLGSAEKKWQIFSLCKYFLRCSFICVAIWVNIWKQLT